MTTKTIASDSGSVTPGEDQRPPIWTGHLTVRGADPEASAEFYEILGMRRILKSPEMAILEMRGGTHLIVLRGEAGEPGRVPFDLMVDELPACHDRWAAAGLTVTSIAPTRGNIHNAFTISDPDGRAIVVLDSHVVGAV